MRASARHLQHLSDATTANVLAVAAVVVVMGWLFRGAVVFAVWTLEFLWH